MASPSVSLSRKGLVSVTGMLGGAAFLKHKNLVSLQAERSKWMKYHRESYLCLFTAPHNSHNLKAQYANQCLQGTKKYSFLGHQKCPIGFDLHLRLSIYLLKEILNVACMYWTFFSVLLGTVRSSDFPEHVLKASYLFRQEGAYLKR